MEDLEDIEQLRIAALQTLHAKKMEPRRQITPQPSYLDTRPDFESSISSFPGYNSRVQLSPRTAAFVESNISILNRRKEGIDMKRLDEDRWSRSPSPLPKYKTIKRKSLSPLPQRRSPEQQQKLKSRSPPRKHIKPSRSPPPSSVHASNHQQQLRRGDNNSYPHGHGHHRSSGGSNRYRERSRERHNGHRGVVLSRRAEHRPRTRSKSPVDQQPRRNRGRDEEKRRKLQEERSEEKELSNTSTTKTQQLTDTTKEKRKEEEKVDEKEKEQPMEEEEEEQDEEERDSSDSESSDSSAIDLFASEESESENEGRFKCSRTETSKPAASKVSFSSKMANKKDLLDSVLPDVDMRGRGGGGRDRGFDGRRSNHRGRMEGSRDRARGAFKSSFREVDNGSLDKRRRPGSGTREDRGDRTGEKGNSRLSSSIRKGTTSEKL